MTHFNHIACPHCGSEQSTVQKSTKETREEITACFRTRRCHNCGLLNHTIELHVDEHTSLQFDRAALKRIGELQND